MGRGFLEKRMTKYDMGESFKNVVLRVTYLLNDPLCTLNNVGRVSTNNLLSREGVWNILKKQSYLPELFRLN